jgi:hypothetical protein
MREATAAIQNKIGQFTANPLIRNIVGQKKSSFDIRKIMDEKKIFLVNLSKGRIGEQNAGLLGAMIVTKIYLAAMSRADSSKAELANLPPFFLFVDEFQNFANDSFSDILAEARKYKLNLTIAHQYIEQMEETVRDAVFGNVGTTISFRVGPLDAEVLEKIFLPTFTAEDIVNLGKYQIYLTLMIDGVGSKPFSATNMAPLPRKAITYRNEVIENSRKMYANERGRVQGDIDAWHATVFETGKETKERLKKEAYLAEKAQKEKLIHGDKPAETAPSKIVIPTEIIKKIEQAPKSQQKREFTDKPKTQSLKNLASTKIATDKNKSLLKDALSKALQKPDNYQKQDQSNLQNQKTETAPPPKQEVQETQVNQKPIEDKKPKEIPEDILKQILE